MGSFANSVFSVLLGWIRTAVNEFWNILSSGEGGGMLAWIGENWKALPPDVPGAHIDFLRHVASGRTGQAPQTAPVAEPAGQSGDSSFRPGWYIVPVSQGPAPSGEPSLPPAGAHSPGRCGPCRRDKPRPGPYAAPAWREDVPSGALPAWAAVAAPPPSRHLPPALCHGFAGRSWPIPGTAASVSHK